MKPRMVITMGDPGGIGPEIILKALRQFTPKNTTVIIAGRLRTFFDASKRFRLPFQPNPVGFVSSRDVWEDQLNFIDVTERAIRILYADRKKHFFPPVAAGQIAKANGALSLAALEIASEAAQRKDAEAIVTAPIQKAAVQLVLPGFSGHTDYLAEHEGAANYAMMFVGKRFCVTLVTIHVPLSKVPRLLNKSGVLSKIELTDQFLKRRMKLKRPRIGVCALNPHGREFGREEDRILVPAVTAALKKRICVSGPHSADRIFFDAYHGRFDAVVAMYHDQGLAPFKMVAFNEGVNVTLGLPYLRTSPDHGTAFDIAGKNCANPSPMMNAIRFADESFA